MWATDEGSTDTTSVQTETYEVRFQKILPICEFSPVSFCNQSKAPHECLVNFQISHKVLYIHICVRTVLLRKSRKIANLCNESLILNKYMDKATIFTMQIVTYILALFLKMPTICGHHDIESGQKFGTRLLDKLLRQRGPLSLNGALHVSSRAARSGTGLGLQSTPNAIIQRINIWA